MGFVVAHKSRAWRFGLYLLSSCCLLSSLAGVHAQDPVFTPLNVSSKFYVRDSDMTGAGPDAGFGGKVASKARLNLANGGFIAIAGAGTYLQIRFRDLVTVYAVALQGGVYNAPVLYPVTYRLEYSNNTAAWTALTQDNTGLADETTIYRKNLTTPITGLFFRIYLPGSGYFAMRTELYGTRTNPVLLHEFYRNSSIATANFIQLELQNSQFSSNNNGIGYDSSHNALNANGLNGNGFITVPSSTEYLQINFTTPTKIDAIGIRGIPYNGIMYITSYVIQYFGDDNTTVEFKYVPTFNTGLTNENDPTAYQIFTTPFIAKIIRIAEWTSPSAGYTGLRVNVFGSAVPDVETPYSSSQTPYSSSQTPYSSSQTPYSSSQTPYSSSQTPFSSSQTPFSSSQTPFSSSQTPFSSSQTPYSSSQTAYSSSQTLFSSSATPTTDTPTTAAPTTTGPTTASTTTPTTVGPTTAAPITLPPRNGIPALGVANPLIVSDSQLTAPTAYLFGSYVPSSARLNGLYGVFAGDMYVSFPTLTTLYSIAVQGTTYSNPVWIPGSYILSYSMGDGIFKELPRFFTGLTDTNSIAFQDLSFPVNATIFRLSGCVGAFTVCGFRIEMYGRSAQPVPLAVRNNTRWNITSESPCAFPCDSGYNKIVGSNYKKVQYTCLVNETTADPSACAFLPPPQTQYGGVGTASCPVSTNVCSDAVVCNSTASQPTKGFCAGVYSDLPLSVLLPNVRNGWFWFPMNTDLNRYSDLGYTTTMVQSSTVQTPSQLLLSLSSDWSGNTLVTQNGVGSPTIQTQSGRAMLNFASRTAQAAVEGAAYSTFSSSFGLWLVSSFSFLSGITDPIIYQSACGAKKIGIESSSNRLFCQVGSVKTFQQGVVTDSVQKHVICVHSVSNNTLTIYIDSVAQGVGVDTSSVSFSCASGLDVITNFVGHVFDYAVWELALTSQEVSHVYQAGLNKSVQNVVYSGVDVYIVSGQSNAVGFADYDFLKDPLDQDPRIFEVYRTNGRNGFNYYAQRPARGSFSINFQAHFGKLMLQSTPSDRRIYFASFSLGAQQMTYFLNNFQSYPSLSSFQKTFGDFTVKGILWLQGEAECPSTPLLVVRERLDRVVFGIRNIYKNQTLPFILGPPGLMCTSVIQAHSEVATRRGYAQYLTQLDSCVYPSSDNNLHCFVGFQADQQHFGSAAQRQIGQRMVGAYFNASKSGTTTTPGALGLKFVNVTYVNQQLNVTGAWIDDYQMTGVSITATDVSSNVISFSVDAIYDVTFQTNVTLYGEVTVRLAAKNAVGVGVYQIISIFTSPFVLPTTLTPTTLAPTITSTTTAPTVTPTTASPTTVTPTTAPIPCDPGYFRSETSSNCTRCSPGTYQNATGKSSCLLCDTGSYNDMFGGTSCLLCPSGTHLNYTGGTVCENCNAGTFAAFVGTVDCPTCPEGSCSFSNGSTACYSCSAAPTTDAPTTGAATTAAPTNTEPTTDDPTVTPTTTATPSTAAPTTTPTTEAPATTVPPSTATPITVAPTATVAPTTEAPTTTPPTTVPPTTVPPTTVPPTTVPPTTVPPTTVPPTTTIAPTTVAPTATVAPTTAVFATQSPTQSVTASFQLTVPVEFHTAVSVNDTTAYNTVIAPVIENVRTNLAAALGVDSSRIVNIRLTTGTVLEPEAVHHNGNNLMRKRNKFKVMTLSYRVEVTFTILPSNNATAVSPAEVYQSLKVQVNSTTSTLAFLIQTNIPSFGVDRFFAVTFVISPTTPPTTSSSSSFSTTDMIIGLVVGCVGLVLLGTLGVYLYKRKKGETLNQTFAKILPGGSSSEKPTFGAYAKMATRINPLSKIL